jgi:hypothetical protein
MRTFSRNQTGVMHDEWKLYLVWWVMKPGNQLVYTTNTE